MDRTHYSKLVLALLAPITIIAAISDDSGCLYNYTSLSDIKDAVHSAKASYFNTNVGSRIKGNDYVITSQSEFVYKNKTIRVVIGDKDNTRIVAIAVPWEARHLTATVRKAMFTGKTLGQFNGHNTSVSPFIWGAVKILIKGIQGHMQDPSTKYVITGHSLGGAVASVLALYMTKDGDHIWKNNESRLITFGEPRVGGKSFSDLHDKLIHPARKVRVVYGRDMIPHIPACIYGWRHANRELWLKTMREWRVSAQKESLLQCINTKYLSKSIRDHSINRYITGLHSRPRVFKRVQREIIRYRYYGFKVVRVKLHSYRTYGEAVKGACKR